MADKTSWTERAKAEFEELQNQMMEAYEKWDSEEGATALGWHERIDNILKQCPKETK